LANDRSQPTPVSQADCVDVCNAALRTLDRRINSLGREQLFVQYQMEKMNSGIFVFALSVLGTSPVAFAGASLCARNEAVFFPAPYSRGK
jgi:hypothetical protein